MSIKSDERQWELANGNIESRQYLLSSEDVKSEIITYLSKDENNVIRDMAYNHDNADLKEIAKEIERQIKYNAISYLLFEDLGLEAVNRRWDNLNDAYNHYKNVEYIHPVDEKKISVRVNNYDFYYDNKEDVEKLKNIKKLKEIAKDKELEKDKEKKLEEEFFYEK